jgi:tetratricopeptide (TPR) repeat protein
VFWIHASTKTRFEQAYQEMAERLELPGRDNPEANVLRLVYTWLSDEANGQWHIILDNVDDGSMFFGNNSVATGVSQHDQVTDSQPPLESFLPQSRNGSILITSRNSTAADNLVGTLGKLVPVEPMKEKDSVDLLKTKIPVDKCSEADLKELAKALEGIPLAITHAAAYIRSRPRVTVSKYLSLFQESEANQASLLNNNETKDLRRDHSIRHAVITTWQISFDQIQRTKTEAAELLSLMAMFDRQGIPESILQDGRDRLQFEDAVAPLTSFSLIKVQSTKQPEQQVGEHLFEMHDLVQLATRKWLEVHMQVGRWQKASLRIMATAFPSGQHGTWASCRVLLPHARKVLGYVWRETEATLDRARIGNKTVWYLILTGEYAAAEKIGRATITGRVEALGVEHPDTLTGLSNLGLVLQRQGKYKEAEAMHQRALEAREEVLGGEHLNTLTSLNNLGSVLNSQGKYEEAEAMYQRALEAREKVLGVEHPNTLTSLNNLGSVLNSQGKYKEAEAIHRRALEATEKVLGLEHPNTLTSFNNLGSVLERQGKYKEAEAMHWRALEATEKVLGVEHPDTLTSFSNLGLVLERQGKHKEAEAIHQRVLEAREKMLGVEHPNTLTSMANLASTLWSQGQWKEAEDIEVRVIETRQRVLGHEHPDTLTAIGNLAFTLKSQSHNKEAFSLMEICLQQRERVLGHHHPDTKSSLEALNEWQMENIEIGV